MIKNGQTDDIQFYGTKGMLEEAPEPDNTPDIDPEDAGWCVLCFERTYGKCQCWEKQTKETPDE